MAHEHLTTELISNPSLWRLALEVRRDQLEIVIVSMMDDHTLIHRILPLAENVSDKIAPLSTAIYDNPLVLSDFGRIDILVDTQRRLIVPAAVTSEDLQHEMLSVLWGDDGYSVIADGIANCNDQLLMGVDDALLGFLRRTFPTARIMHRLTPLARYFYSKERLNGTSRLYVHLQQQSIDLIYVNNGHLHALNTFETPTIDDMIYYILAVAKYAGIDLEDDSIMICGAPDLREQVRIKLRTYASQVMPVVFPSSLLSMGGEAMTVPFELIILPLCE